MRKNTIPKKVSQSRPNRNGVNPAPSSTQEPIQSPSDKLFKPYYIGVCEFLISPAGFSTVIVGLLFFLLGSYCSDRSFQDIQNTLNKLEEGDQIVIETPSPTAHYHHLERDEPIGDISKKCFGRRGYWKDLCKGQPPEHDYEELACNQQNELVKVGEKILLDIAGIGPAAKDCPYQLETPTLMSTPRATVQPSPTQTQTKDMKKVSDILTSIATVAATVVPAADVHLNTHNAGQVQVITTPQPTLNQSVAGTPTSTPIVILPTSTTVPIWTATPVPPTVVPPAPIPATPTWTPIQIPPTPTWTPEGGSITSTVPITLPQSVTETLPITSNIPLASEPTPMWTPQNVQVSP